MRQLRTRALGVAAVAITALTMAAAVGNSESGGVGLLAANAAPLAKPSPTPTPTTETLEIRVGRGNGSGLYNALGDGSRSPDDESRSHEGQGRGVGERKLTDEDRHKIVWDCWAKTQDTSCFYIEGDANSAMLTGSDARAIAVTLVTNLRFPAPKPVFGPDPNKNEWRMLAVGYPVWLWTEGPTTVSTSASAYGFTFRMTARWRSTTFHLGDGKSVTCTAMTRYSAAVVPGAASPNCGHVYTKPSLPRGTYQVRAVADWDVSWSVAGFSGVVPAYNEASSSIPIGELVALNR